MFGGSVFPGMENDPFYDMHRAHMQRMNQMMQSPFMMTPPMSPFMPVTDGREHQRDHQRRGQRHQERELARRDEFRDPFESMFGNMNSMMTNMRSMMGNMHTQNPFETQMQQQAPSNNNGQFYSSSTVMTYSNDGRGQPKVYQATSTTKQTGGVKETQKTVRDSDKGIEKMAIGRHIGDKSHVVTKERNRRTGDLTENEDLLNLDEDDLTQFEEEWRQRAGRTRGPHDRTAHRAVGQHHRPRHHTPAIEHHPHHRAPRHH